MALLEDMTVEGIFLGIQMFLGLIEYFACDEIWSASNPCTKQQIKNVNPNCPRASNPFYKYTNYCFEKITGKV